MSDLTYGQQIAQEIIADLLDMCASTPNERTDSVLTSFKRNEIMPGVSAAIDRIKQTFDLPKHDN